MDSTKHPKSLHARLREAFALYRSPIRILQPRSPFLLPIDIRLIIYEYAFASGEPRSPLGLLRASKQVLAECYPITLPNIQLCFSHLTKFLEFWQGLEEKSKPKVKRLKIFAVNVEDIRQIPAILCSKSAGLRLDVLTLVFDVDIPFEEDFRALLCPWEITLPSGRTDGIQVIRIVNTRERNRVQLAKIFARQPLRMETGDDKFEAPSWIYGFYEEEEPGVVNPAYRIVKTAALAKVLRRPDMVGSELEMEFFERSKRAFAMYPEPPLQSVTG